MLTTFPAVRLGGHRAARLALGWQALAVGFAPSPVLAISLPACKMRLSPRPIRIDDVVIVEKRMGRWEKLPAAYVVVRIWDDRRFGKCRCSKLIEQPFRTGLDTLIHHRLGILRADYGIPCNPLRRSWTGWLEKVRSFGEARVKVLQGDPTQTDQGIQLKSTLPVQPIPAPIGDLRLLCGKI